MNKYLLGSCFVTIAALTFSPLFGPLPIRSLAPDLQVPAPALPPGTVEMVGEDGARQWAARQHWRPLVDGQRSTLPQGFDQVYVSPDGFIRVVEAKGGRGHLREGYGHRQATPEWAVKAAERTLRSNVASTAEKEAAKAVLRAAVECRLIVHVIRTKIGSTPFQESSAVGTRQTSALATETIELLARQGIPVLDHPTKFALAIRTTMRIAAPVGLGVDVGARAYHANLIEDAFIGGEWSQQQREIAHTRNVTGFAGGWIGALAGAKIGCSYGVAIGTFLFPVKGTILGGSLGAISGAVIGYVGGETLAEAAAAAIVESLHERGGSLFDGAHCAWEALWGLP